MKVVLLGVRGSRCAPGAAFARVGGHTSSVLITPRAPGASPLILDAGTGLSSIDTGDTGFDGDILLTHLHWDHVQGIPFFAAGDSQDARVRVRLPAQGSARPNRPGSAAALLAQSMAPPHFPIGPENLRGEWSFDAIDDASFELGAFRVTAVEVPHKGGRTFGYRVTEDDVTVAYLPDFCPENSSSSCLDVARGADVLLIGGMFAGADRSQAYAYGHATIDDAAELAVEARAGSAVIVHHAPTRTDQQVEELFAGLPTSCGPIRIGRENDVVLDD